MKIGLVLSKPPSYSETFFNSKIEGLVVNGFDITLFVQNNAEDYKTCKVITAPKIYKNRIIQSFNILYVLITLLPYFKRLLCFCKLEKRYGRSTKQFFKNTYTNAHLLKSNLDWLHFGFATLAIQSEHVAKAINSKMAISLRGFDICVYPIKNSDCYELLWENVDKVHVISDDLLELAYKNGMLKTTPFEKISPAINIGLFKQKGENRLNIPIKIVTVARLHWKKGLLETLEALKVLKDMNVEFHFSIVGSGDAYEELAFARYQLGLVDNVTFLGELEQTKIIELLSNTNIYIQFSLSEGFCNALLEAQAMGCICIASDAEGLTENILAGETGFIVKKQNINKLAETIIKVINDYDNIMKMITPNATKRINELFTIKEQEEKFIKFYE